MRAACGPWHRRLLTRIPPWLFRLVLRFEAAIEERVGDFAGSLPCGARVLDAGAGEGQYAHFFSHCRYAGVDLGVGEAAWDYSRLDARADLAALPFRNGAFDAALNVVVLEHTREPHRIVAELARVLRPGAPLLLVAPQQWAVHQAPHDYFRFTRHGLEWLLGQAGFDDLDIEPAGGFFTLLGRDLLEAVLYFQGGGRWLLFPLAAALAGPVGVALPWLDFLDGRKETTLGYICLARKR
jgi:SAM-dependent methyltransferase